VVAKAYRPVVRDQVFLLPPDMREWLPDDHPVWLVIEAVGQLDTSAFHARRRLGGAGAAAYDPDMMITMLVWAYANQVTSSRRIERLCGQDVAFRVICGGNLPDHVKVARFRQQFPDAAAGLFTQVLVLCARLGMGRLGMVALDGTKISANAAVDANRGEEKLAGLAAAVAAHAAADAQEDALFPAGPGDQARRRTRGPRIPGPGGSRPRWPARGLSGNAVTLRRRPGSRPARTRPRSTSRRRGPSPHAAAAELARLAVHREIAAYQAKVAARDAAIAAGRAVPGRPPVPAGSTAGSARHARNWTRPWPGTMPGTGAASAGSRPGPPPGERRSGGTSPTRTRGCSRSAAGTSRDTTPRTHSARTC
jgi:transposase